MPETETVDFEIDELYETSIDLTEEPGIEIDFDDETRHAIERPAPVKPAGSFSLRDYQEAAVQSIDHELMRVRSTLAVLATGAGKTVIFSQVTLQEVTQRGGKVLIIAHTEELLDQAADKLYKTTGLEAAREKAAERASTFDDVVVASVQTMGRPARLETWAPDHFGLIIIDEAHRSLATTYRRIIDHFASAKVLGVTATADRGDQKSLGRVYDSIAFEYGILEACRDGYLVRPWVQTVPLSIDLSGLIATKGKSGDYNAIDVADRIEPFLREIAKVLAEMERKDPRRTVIFLPSVDTASMMADALKSEGLTADFVAGDKKRCPDRKRRLAAFERGEFQFIANAMLLTEGFDSPAIARVVNLRPTKIRGLFCQIIGRGTRILPGVIDHLNGPDDREARIEAIAASSKTNLQIVDFLWITEKLDLIKPANLVSGDPEVVKRMIEKSEDGDLIDQEEEAERDLLESIKREAEKNRNKKGKTFDPLEKAFTLGDEELANYRPDSQWAAQRPTDDQVKILVKHGLDPARIRYRGLAAKWIQKVITREKMGLCSLKQMSFLDRMKIPGAHQYTAEDAKKAIGRRIQNFKRKGRR